MYISKSLVRKCFRFSCVRVWMCVCRILSENFDVHLWIIRWWMSERGLYWKLISLPKQSDWLRNEKNCTRSKVNELIIIHTFLPMAAIHSRYIYSIYNWMWINWNENLYSSKHKCSNYTYHLFLSLSLFFHTCASYIRLYLRCKCVWFD